MSAVKVTLPAGAVPTHGLQVSFEAPCACQDVTDIVIDGEYYELVDAMGNRIAEYNATAWCAGSIVTVMLDTANYRAFMLNASIKELIESYVASKHLVFDIMLPASRWQGTTPPYTLMLNGGDIANIRPDDTPHYTVIQTGDIDSMLEVKEAFAMIDYLETGYGLLIFRCLEDKPTVDMRVQLEVNRT